MSPSGQSRWHADPQSCVAVSERSPPARQIRLPAIDGKAVRELAGEGSALGGDLARADCQESIQTQYPHEVLKVLVEMLQDPVARCVSRMDIRLTAVFVPTQARASSTFSIATSQS